MINESQVQQWSQCFVKKVVVLTNVQFSWFSSIKMNSNTYLQSVLIFLLLLYIIIGFIIQDLVLVHGSLLLLGLLLLYLVITDQYMN